MGKFCHDPGGMVSRSDFDTLWHLVYRHIFTLGLLGNIVLEHNREFSTNIFRHIIPNTSINSTV